MMKRPFSVLMSLYYKEKAEYADQCFQSLLAQTVPADEWVIVEDGPLTDELYRLLETYEQQYPKLIKRIPLKENQGLGLALRNGVPQCSYELIARMDTDDIARNDRFEKQLKEFDDDPLLDLCGSHISEFEEDPQIIVAQRKVPLTEKEIRIYQRRRDAFNHVTVMYKKQAVLEAGNYQDCPLMEDTLLWANMLKNNVKCKNIDDDLVYTRIGKGMYERRGGLAYYRKYKAGRKKVLDTGFISLRDYYVTLAVQLVVAIIPGSIRGWIFRRLLHGNG